MEYWLSKLSFLRCLIIFNNLFVHSLPFFIFNFVSFRNYSYSYFDIFFRAWSRKREEFRLTRGWRVRSRVHEFSSKKRKRIYTKVSLRLPFHQRAPFLLGNVLFDFNGALWTHRVAPTVWFQHRKEAIRSVLI